MAPHRTALPWLAASRPVVAFSSFVLATYIFIKKHADTPILTDGLMSLMPLSKPTASNEADWREA